MTTQYAGRRIADWFNFSHTGPHITGPFIVISFNNKGDEKLPEPNPAYIEDTLRQNTGHFGKKGIEFPDNPDLPNETTEVYSCTDPNKTPISGTSHTDVAIPFTRDNIHGAYKALEGFQPRGCFNIKLRAPALTI